MAHSARTIRIVSACAVALLLIGGGYALSGPIPFLSTRIAGAQSPAELLRAYAAKDTDQDGLEDWQEALYNTDPYNPESFEAGIKDGDAVAQGLIQPKVTVAEAPAPTDLDSIPGTAAAPNSVTDRFAQELFKQYVLGRGTTAPTTEQIATFVEDGVHDLVETNAVPDTFVGSDIRASGTSGPAATRTYLEQVELAFANNTIPSDKNELLYFADAVNGDAAALKQIKDISGAYKNIANALMKVPVPEGLQLSQLKIANAVMHMSEVTADMASMEDDPIRALMGIGLYEEYVVTMASAFANLNDVLTAQQITLTETEPGYSVFIVARDGAQIKASRATQ